jgi:isopentenyl phosphate kinase
MSMIKILKIGGSVLTDKNRPACARTEEIERVTREAAASSSGLVIVHGAGSFGHIPAKKYGLPEKFDPEGLRETHTSVVRLNELVVSALSRAGADPVPVHPLSCVLLRGGRIETVCTEPISEMVKRGLVPVLHGDVAMDALRGSGIVSGDQLVSYLARALCADVVAVGTDVDGVIFNGIVLPRVTRADLPMITESLGESTGVDVTGGMKGKLLELLDLADAGIVSAIFNARIEGRLERALKGESVGTRVGRTD